MIRNGKRGIHVSEKYALHRRIKLESKDKVFDYVLNWILNDPELVYMHVYDARKYNVQQIYLTKDAINLLKDQLAKHYPHLLNEILYRKKHKTNSSIPNRKFRKRTK